MNPTVIPGLFIDDNFKGFIAAAIQHEEGPMYSAIYSTPMDRYDMFMAMAATLHTLITGFQNTIIQMDADIGDSEGYDKKRRAVAAEIGAAIASIMLHPTDSQFQFRQRPPTDGPEQETPGG